MSFVSSPIAIFANYRKRSTPEEEIAAEPWFSVRENDIFPEEFLDFLAFPKPALDALLRTSR